MKALRRLTRQQGVATAVAGLGLFVSLVLLSGRAEERVEPDTRSLALRAETPPRLVGVRGQSGDPSGAAVGAASSPSVSGARAARFAPSRIRGALVRDGVALPGRIEVIALESRPDTSNPGSSPSSSPGPVLLEPRALPHRDVHTSADGHYEIDGLDPGQYQLRAVSSDGLGGVAHVDLALAGMVVDADIPVGPGAVLEGRLLLGAESPGAWRLLACEYRDDDPSAAGRHWTEVARTAEGGFLVPGRAGSGIGLRLVGPRAVLVRTVARLPRSGPYLLDVQDPKAFVCLRVSEAESGRPVAGAVVSALPAWPERGHATAWTGDDGLARVPLPWEEDTVLVVRATGRTPRELPWPAARDRTGVHDVQLAAGGTLVGRVVRRPDGLPVEGIEVRYLPERAPPVRSLWPRGSRTDADGRFELSDLPVGPASLLAAGAGWVGSMRVAEEDGRSLISRSASQLAGTTSLTLTVERAASLMGSVSDEFGQPVRGALVRAAPCSPDGWHDYNGVLENVPQARAVSAEDGSFTLHGLLPGAAHVLVASLSRRDHVRVLLKAEELLVGRPQRLILPGRRVLRLDVRDEATGVAVPEAYCVLEQVDVPSGGIDVAEYEGTTDRSGIARVEHRLAAEYVVRVGAPGYFEVSRVVRTQVGSLEIALRRGFRLAGCVVSRAGTPVRDAWLTIRGAGVVGRISTTTGRDGCFDLLLPTEDPCSIEVSGEDGGVAWGVGSSGRSGGEKLVIVVEPVPR